VEPLVDILLPVVHHGLYIVIDVAVREVARVLETAPGLARESWCGCDPAYIIGSFSHRKVREYNTIKRHNCFTIGDGTIEQAIMDLSQLILPIFGNYRAFA
jgi:hypothetical protein